MSLRWLIGPGERSENFSMSSESTHINTIIERSGNMGWELSVVFFCVESIAVYCNYTWAMVTVFCFEWPSLLIEPKSSGSHQV